MAILKLQLIGVVLFFLSALEAQESPAAESVATIETTASPGSTAAGDTIGESNGSSSTVPASPLNDDNPGTSDNTTTKYSTAPANPLNDDNPGTSNNTTTKPDATDPPKTEKTGSLENGGYPYVKPGKHRSGQRHVRAHDGFHSLLTEKNWAHWNDAFTTSQPGGF